MASANELSSDVLLDDRDEDLWVFGYGSLMWRPGFEFKARHKAYVFGWRRRLCIYSHLYRGTAERPGLVLGLDAGGECAGVAFCVESRFRKSTIQYLRERELVTAVYLERMIPATLESGETIEALSYLADSAHSQYAAPMAPEKLLELVQQGVGLSGANVEYVANTLAHLHKIGIADTELEWLVERL
jgi:cation transport protein ChaC